MRKRAILCLLTAGLLVAALAAGADHVQAEKIREMEQFASHCAYRAYDRFSVYREKGSEYDYHYAVAELTAFYNAYTWLTVEKEGSTNTNCIHLNQLLGKLMDYPELTSRQLSQLVTMTYELSKDCDGDAPFYRAHEIYTELVKEPAMFSPLDKKGILY